MILATTKVEDFDRWIKVFSGKSAEKRKQHGEEHRYLQEPVRIPESNLRHVRIDANTLRYRSENFRLREIALRSEL
ncbi:MAG: hypothetical protein HYR76_00330 [Ignavibacteria bacterium]|nr:hypothetical protein [Ignavibacteria bacterium]